MMVSAKATGSAKTSTSSIFCSNRPIRFQKYSQPSSSSSPPFQTSLKSPHIWWNQFIWRRQNQRVVLVPGSNLILEEETEQITHGGPVPQRFCCVLPSVLDLSMWNSQTRLCWVGSGGPRTGSCCSLCWFWSRWRGRFCSGLINSSFAFWQLQLCQSDRIWTGNSAARLQNKSTTNLKLKRKTLKEIRWIYRLFIRQTVGGLINQWKHRTEMFRHLVQRIQIVWLTEKIPKPKQNHNYK